MNKKILWAFAISLLLFIPEKKIYMFIYISEAQQEFNGFANNSMDVSREVEILKFIHLVWYQKIKIGINKISFITLTIQ